MDKKEVLISREQSKETLAELLAYNPKELEIVIFEAKKVVSLQDLNYFKDIIYSYSDETLLSSYPSNIQRYIRVANIYLAHKFAAEFKTILLANYQNFVINNSINMRNLLRASINEVVKSTPIQIIMVFLSLGIDLEIGLGIVENDLKLMSNKSHDSDDKGIKYSNSIFLSNSKNQVCPFSNYASVVMTSLKEFISIIKEQNLTFSNLKLKDVLQQVCLAQLKPYGIDPINLDIQSLIYRSEQ